MDIKKPPEKTDYKHILKLTRRSGCVFYLGDVFPVQLEWSLGLERRAQDPA